MNWREKIEAQIAEIDTYTDCPDGHVFRRWRDTMQALYDVAVAADGISFMPSELKAALDKLREVGDE